MDSVIGKKIIKNEETNGEKRREEENDEKREIK